MIFEEKYFSCYILLPEHISLPGCLCFVRYWAICVLQLFLNQVLTSLILKLVLYFWSSRFLYMTKKSRQKNLNILRMKRVFNVKRKAFFIIFKELSLKQIRQFFGRWVSNFKFRRWKFSSLRQDFVAFNQWSFYW